jgi:hypothetical protein
VACLGRRRKKEEDGGEERFHRSPTLALRLTRRRLAIRQHPQESAALKRYAGPTETSKSDSCANFSGQLNTS